MNNQKILCTIVFPSVLELAEFKMKANIPWEALDVEKCSLTAKVTDQDLAQVPSYGGIIYYNNSSSISFSLK